MTALCGGGPSARRPETPITGYFVGNELENMVQTALGVSEFWASIIVLLVQQNFDWDTLCASDPPAMPTFSALEIAEIVTSPIAPTDLPWQKLSDLVLNAAWWYGCQCSAVSTPAPPSWPAVPPGAPVQDTPGAPPSVSAPCSDVTSSFTFPSTTLSPNPGQDETVRWLPGTPATGLIIQPGTTNTGLAIPTGVTAVAFTGTATIPSPIVVAPEFGFQWFDASKALLGSQLLVQSTQTSFNVTVAIPTGARYWALYGYNGAGNGGYPISMAALVTCSSGPNTIQQPCCPPDQSLMAAVRQILLQVQADHDLILNTQRYGVPFGYISSTAHTGLTGSGSFAIGTLLGMRASVTAYPAGNQTFTGTPPYISDLGWMSVESADGFIDEIRLTRQNQLWMSRLFQTGTTFGYALREGVTANFIELEAEH